MAVEARPADPDEGAVSPNVAYEHSDVNLPRMALLAASVLVTALVAILLVAPPFFGLKEHRAEVSPRRSPEAPAGLREPPQPRLQAAPEDDYQSYTATYDRVLGSYSWVDRAKGIAAIPLDRAMQIASRRGIPRWPVNPSIQLPQPHQGTRLTGLGGKDVEPTR